MEHQKSLTEQVTIHQATSVGLFSYWPIAAMYVAAALVSLYSVTWHMQPDYMSHVMGWVLVFFGLIKISDVAGFAAGFAKYDPLAERSRLYAQAYPFLEIILGILFVLQLLILPAALITLGIYSVSLFGALQSIRKEESLHCVCLGTYFKLPLSTVTVIEAGFMIGMCVWMLIMFNSMAMVM